MNLKVRNRLIITLVLFLSSAIGVSLILYFLSDNIVFFITPSEISDKHLGKKIRIGGLVEPGSILSSRNFSKKNIRDPVIIMDPRLRGDDILAEDDIIVAEDEVLAGDHVVARGDGIIFTISDGEKSMKIKYRGILPGLFRESQGVVVEGVLKDKAAIFEAKALLTKHDENYKPPNKKEKR